MRFVFVDRIIAMDPGRAIETLKNVSATEDVFNDHFPGCPILPGALVLEAVEQAAQLLIAVTYSFDRVGRFQRLSRASFRRFVRPGDQLYLRCRRLDRLEETWTVGTSAEVAGRTVATATLEFVIESGVSGSEAGDRASRLREMAGVLREGPLDLVRLGISS